MLPVDLHPAATQGAQDAPFNYLAAHDRRLEDRLSSGHYRLGFMMSGAPFFAFEGWDSTVVAG